MRDLFALFVVRRCGCVRPHSKGGIADLPKRQTGSGQQNAQGLARDKLAADRRGSLAVRQLGIDQRRHACPFGKFSQSGGKTLRADIETMHVIDRERRITGKNHAHQIHRKTDCDAPRR